MPLYVIKRDVVRVGRMRFVRARRVLSPWVWPGIGLATMVIALLLWLLA